MSTRSESIYLQDIITSFERISHYVTEMSFDEFFSDAKTIDAVIRNIIVIGEAVNRLPESLINAHPDLPWHAMRGLRNVVVHEYSRIDLYDLWDTVHVDLPAILPVIKNLADDLLL
ncbi:DUF86 domain-containing protein [Gemmatimonadota bacterium]